MTAGFQRRLVKLPNQLRGSNSSSAISLVYNLGQVTQSPYHSWGSPHARPELRAQQASLYGILSMTL